MATINKIQFGDTEYDISVNAENIEGEIPVDLSNYYNKTETEGKIDEKINAIPVNDLLHYKGNVGSEEELPPAGQPSGVLQSSPFRFNSNNGKIFFKEPSDIVKTKLGVYTNYKNFIEITNNSEASIIVMTDYPEQVSVGGSYFSRNYYENYCLDINIIYDPEKPVYYSYYGSNQRFSIAYNIGGSKGYSAPPNTMTLRTATSDTFLTIMPTYSGYERGYSFYRYDTRYGGYENGSMILRTNFSTIKYKYFADKFKDITGYGNYSCNCYYDLKDSYVWTDNMRFLANESYAKNVSTNKQNDLWAVGDNNDLYRYDNVQGWIELSKSSGGSPIEVKNEYNDSQIDTYSCDFINKNKEIYSTEEVRIGTWIDGKPLYRKVVDCGYLPAANTAKPVNHNIENIGIIKTCEGVAFKEDQYLALPFFHISNGIRINASQTQVFITPMTSRTEHYAYVWLEYTKTTDAATISLANEPIVLEEE